MRRVSVQLGPARVMLRIPVPSKIQTAIQSLQVGEDLAALERAYIGVLAAHAVEDWTWPVDPAEAWVAMWDDGVAWSEVRDAVGQWVTACNSALGVLLEAAEREASTFPVGAAVDGDRQP